MALILPTILESNANEFEKKLKLASQNVDRIQIDIVDHHLIANKTLSIENWPTLPSNLIVDGHLMVNKPLNYLIELASKSVGTVIVHWEHLKKHQEFLIKNLEIGIKSGLAICLETNIKTIPVEVLNKFAQILLLAVPMGLSGQKFNPLVLDKIKWLRQYCDYSAEIIIDGGINLNSASLCFQAGATGMAVNSFLWQNFPVHLYQLQKLV